MKYFSIRATCGYAFAACCVLIVSAAYFQVVIGLEPCPLCILQRFAWLGLTLMFFIGMLYRNPSKRWLYIHQGITLAIAIIGGLFAGKQVWLQYFPSDDVPECGPGLSYMLDNFSFPDIVSFFFQGTGHCAEIDWEFLQLSLGAWSLLFFLLIAGLAVFNLWRASSKDKQ